MKRHTASLLEILIEIIINYQVDDINLRPRRGCVPARLQARAVKAVTVCASESHVWQEATRALGMKCGTISLQSDTCSGIETDIVGSPHITVFVCLIH